MTIAGLKLSTVAEEFDITGKMLRIFIIVIGSFKFQISTIVVRITGY